MRNAPKRSIFLCAGKKIRKKKTLVRYWIAYSGSEKRMETFRNAAPQTWAYFEALEKNNWRS